MNWKHIQLATRHGSQYLISKEHIAHYRPSHMISFRYQICGFGYRKWKMCPAIKISLHAIARDLNNLIMSVTKASMSTLNVKMLASLVLPVSSNKNEKKKSH